MTTEDDVDDRWDRRPRVVSKGVEYFTIGQFARALNRKPVTIRSWEMKGAIPKAKYRLPKSGDQEGQRLYSRPQVEGMIEICARHGLLEFHVRPQAATLSDAFTADVIALWKRT